MLADGKRRLRRRWRPVIRLGRRERGEEDVHGRVQLSASVAVRKGAGKKRKEKEDGTRQKTKTKSGRLHSD